MDVNSHIQHDSMTHRERSTEAMPYLNQYSEATPFLLICSYFLEVSKRQSCGICIHMLVLIQYSMCHKPLFQGLPVLHRLAECSQRRPVGMGTNCSSRIARDGLNCLPQLRNGKAGMFAAPVQAWGWLPLNVRFFAPHFLWSEFRFC